LSVFTVKRWSGNFWQAEDDFLKQLLGGMDALQLSVELFLVLFLEVGFA
jgi:hypothetical protein